MEDSGGCLKRNVMNVMFSGKNGETGAEIEKMRGKNETDGVRDEQTRDLRMSFSKYQEKRSQGG